MKGFCIVILALLLVVVAYGRLDVLIRNICERHELKEARKHLQSYKSPDSRQLFLMAALELILLSDVDLAVQYHKKAKALGADFIPPLAELHLKGNSCGGTSDLYYVAAVITKQMVDISGSPSAPPQLNKTKQWKDALNTLVTLTADSGMHEAAETHWKSAWALVYDGPDSSSYKDDDRSLMIAWLFRGSLMTPPIYSSLGHIRSTRQQLQERLELLDRLVSKGGFSLSSLDEFSLSTTFYLVYQGYNDRHFLETLHRCYRQAFPALDFSIPSSSAVLTEPARPLRVGFVSNYFRRHSICKLFCGIIEGLAQESLEIFVFSSVPLNQEDQNTHKLRNLATEKDNFHFVHVNKMFIGNRAEVVDRRVDVLVYLDVGMDPSSVVWASSRLAPIQIGLWGHPTTTGQPTIDYYMSSERFHRHWANYSNPGESFSEQLVLLNSTGFAFPWLDLLPSELYTPVESPLIALRTDAFGAALLSALQSLPESKGQLAITRLQSFVQSGNKLILCPQFLPKMHPMMDGALLALLRRSPRYKLVMLESEKKGPWRQTILKRWRKAVGQSEFQKIQEQIEWMPSLSPTEYLAMLASGHVMVDPYPFGGGVTALEALTACTPVLTLPVAQHVPQLAAGILKTLFEGHSTDDYELLVARTEEDYVAKATALLEDESLTRSLRISICANRGRLFGESSANSLDSVRDWSHMLGRLHRQLLVASDVE